MNFKRRLCCSVAVCLSLFTMCGGNLYAANDNEADNGEEIAVNETPRSAQAAITFNPGSLRADTLTLVADSGATITLTDMGVSSKGFVLLGWHTLKMPLVTSFAVEKMIKNVPAFYPKDSEFTATDSTTLYAVWAMDQDQDGFPDYGGTVIMPSLSKKVIDEIYAKEGIEFRSGTIPNHWDNNYDLAAYLDSVYYVGCMYNLDTVGKLTEPLICFNANCFQGGNRALIKANIPLQLVIEYDGVLVNGSMIGGKNQESLTRIDMIPGTSIDSLLDYHPFMFDSIMEDGLGILKMYFVDPNRNDSLPKEYITGSSPAFNKGSSNWGTWAKPFKDPHTGELKDTCVFKFHIYNKPVFESTVISQRINAEGYLDLKHLSGTSLKHMMRSVEGIGWRPADSPLTLRERDEIIDGGSLCLRELDKTIGYAMYQKAYYFTSEFNRTKHSTEANLFYNECLEIHIDTLWNSHLSTSSPLSAAAKIELQDEYSFIMTMGPLHSYLARQMALFNASNGVLFSKLYAPPYTGTPADIIPGDIRYNQTTTANKIWAHIDANWYTIYAKKVAAKVVVPAPCREMHCLEFGKSPDPVIKRSIELNTIAGVTSDLGEGKHYVTSQKNFSFTLTFADGKPLKVMVTGVTTGEVEELFGTDMGGGTYRYILYRVVEPKIVNVLNESPTDNESIANDRVWTYGNTLYIRTDKAIRASIYTLSGALYRQIDVPVGTVSEVLGRGVYIVELDNVRYKMVIK